MNLANALLGFPLGCGSDKFAVVSSVMTRLVLLAGCGMTNALDLPDEETMYRAFAERD